MGIHSLWHNEKYFYLRLRKTEEKKRSLNHKNNIEQEKQIDGEHFLCSSFRPSHDQNHDTRKYVPHGSNATPPTSRALSQHASGHVPEAWAHDITVCYRTGHWWRWRCAADADAPSAAAAPSGTRVSIKDAQEWAGPVVWQTVYLKLLIPGVNVLCYFEGVLYGSKQTRTVTYSQLNPVTIQSHLIVHVIPISKRLPF